MGTEQSINRLTRRSALAAMAGAAVSRAAQGRPIRLGGPIFLKSDDPAELAREHRRLGYSAAYCPDAKAEDSVHTRAIEKAFAAENVVIAEVGAWKNILDPNAEKRAANIAYVVSRLALAEAVGARCCVDIAGSFNPDIWFGPNPKNLSQEFFDATVENSRRIIDQIKPKRTLFTLEMMPWTLPDGPDSYLRLIKAIDRKQFGVHMDVCNAVNSPERYYRNSELIAELFRKLGPSIASCHAKDLSWATEYNVHFVEVAPGQGQVDYRAYLTELSKLPVDAPLMLEHLKTPEDYESGKNHIFRIGKELGLPFA